MKTSYDRLKSREITTTAEKNLAKAGFFDRFHVHERKDVTMPLIIHYYLLKHSEHYTNLSTLNHNVRFLPCQHQGVGIMQYVYALNPVCIVLIIPGHSRSSPSGLWT